MEKIYQFQWEKYAVSTQANWWNMVLLIGCFLRVLSQTLKVKESKVALFFIFGLFLDIGYFSDF